MEVWLNYFGLLSYFYCCLYIFITLVNSWKTHIFEFNSLHCYEIKI